MTRCLGFTRVDTPCAATLYAIFGRLDVAALEEAVGAWALGVLQALPAAPGTLEAVATDGKRLRGSGRRGAPLVHLLGAVSHRLGLLLGQRALPDKTSEVRALSMLAAGLVLQGVVVTLDALFTERRVAQLLLDQGGDYLLIAKHNQPTVREDIAYLFADTAAVAERFADARTVDGGHGRVEVRTLTSSDALVGYLDWPGLAQVFRLTRRVTDKRTGLVRHETVYGLTSLTAERAGPAALLALVRGHWTIENRQHYVRDVTFGEDASQVHCGALPEALSLLRSTAIGLLRASGETALAAACRRLAAQPHAALALLHWSPNN